MNFIILYFIYVYIFEVVIYGKDYDFVETLCGVFRKNYMFLVFIEIGYLIFD